jgi:hypothetical protein
MVNNLSVIDPRARQHRKGPNNVGKPTANNPNLILVAEKNRFSNKELGELANNGEEILAWVCEPIPELGNTEGDVNQQSKSWI